MSDLPTQAEKNADEIRKYPSFRSVSLPAIRVQVAELLSLIGRIEGVFSTYSLHDISHIDSMLNMLEWLIPSSTRAAMTPADWLMTVLSIYLHDLGMLVTAEEFEERTANASFNEWVASLEKSSDGGDYLARTFNMSPAERDRFLFQEFIRIGHASRIREWITGRHSRRWGPAVNGLAGTVSELLKPLPARFRDDLGTICESHHADNLHNRALFPLSVPYGNNQAELVNLQYAAILLRTADLLHVTKDRTPSVAYKIIKISDPKGVDEWDKQSGVFVVRPKGRTLIEGNADSAVIVVHADFTEERPLFALQEYIAYANSQVQQSKRWIDKSQEEPDASSYSFPWHAVVGDVRLEGIPPKPLRFELDRGRLLDLLVGHTIYNDATVAIRELLQNSIDAVRFQFYLDERAAVAVKRQQPKMGKVEVRWDQASRRLVIQDNGTGMDLDIITYHLMKVGSSYYGTRSFESEHTDFTPISRFGIGILTCFMVSDDIEIVTFRGSEGYRIRMTSVHSDYLLRVLPAGDPLLDGLEPHGTRVSLRLRSTIDLSARSVLDILKYWIVLPVCEVIYEEQGRPAVNIGFASPEDAVRHYLRAALGDENIVDIVAQEVHLGESGSSRGAKYEMAFAVNRASFLERSFLKANKFQSAVCIEGIRVSDTLPGLDGLAAVLSIRGEKKLRTTVSRSGLEVDREQQRAAEISADLLFSHIEAEVARISQMPGNPLSRASSASHWLYTSLQGAASKLEVSKYLSSKFRLLPSLVLERAADSIKGTPPSRFLVSQNGLAGEEFWTLESRLLDSIGLISRDLGKELSLHEFITALAPEFAQFQYSPLVPDAHIFWDIIGDDYSPALVEFSKEHRQAAIKWSPGRTSLKSLGVKAYEALDPTGFDEFRLLIEEGRYRYAYHRPPDSFSIDAFETAMIGDDPRVEAVSSRVGFFVKPGSAISELYVNLRSGILELAAKKSPREFARLWRVAQATHAGFSGNLLDFNELERTLRDNGELLREYKIPSSLLSLADRVFNATSYWRKWFSRG